MRCSGTKSNEVCTCSINKFNDNLQIVLACVSPDCLEMVCCGIKCISSIVLLIAFVIIPIIPHVNRLRKLYLPSYAPKEASALRIGILGAANIAPPALIWPVCRLEFAGVHIFI